jgi:hypothetical protein
MPTRFHQQNDAGITERGDRADYEHGKYFDDAGYQTSSIGVSTSGRKE